LVLSINIHQSLYKYDVLGPEELAHESTIAYISRVTTFDIVTIVYSITNSNYPTPFCNWKSANHETNHNVGRPL